jgi:hypothetical protein
MNLTAFFILATALSTVARAATVTVTITGTTGEIQVGEGPIFGHKSYQLIPAGDPFVLTYIFDEDKGKQSISEVRDNLITQSEIENAAPPSPGVSATLQIGSAVWEFGPATHAQVILKASAAGRSEQLVFNTQSGGNRISSQIVPGKGSYWPKNGDWRAGFTSSSLEGSSASFSADNGSVSAEGKLNPSTIAVTGVDIDGQWLRYTTTTGGPNLASWERKWQLAHPSPRGGVIVEEVTRTIVGTRPDGSPITPSVVKYWQAWRVPAGADAPADAMDTITDTVLSGSKGEESVSTVARFYEGLILPPSFALGNSPYARLSSTSDPKLSTDGATLPVTTSTKLEF